MCRSDDIQIQRLSQIAGPLLAWYARHARTLPWRSDPTPYHVWISEIMLQQTRVEAVKPYYERFLAELPDLQALSDCPEEKLLKLWEGLGYYSRARNLQKAAAVCMEKYGGELPGQYEDLLKLPGIGSYTAGAIASIAFRQPVPAVDGNVLRIISRILEDGEDIRSERMKKKAGFLLEQVIPGHTPGEFSQVISGHVPGDFKQVISGHVPGEYSQVIHGHVPGDFSQVISGNPPGDFNQALMDLGAMICLPGPDPHCGECPLKDLCLAALHGTTDRYPYRSRQKERRLERRIVLVIRDGLRVLLVRRPPAGLLAGMYEFPCIERKSILPQEADDAFAARYVRETGLNPTQVRPLGEAKHVFSHIEWRMNGYQVLVEELKETGAMEERFPHGYVMAELAEVRTAIPVPAAYAAYLKAMLI